MKKFLIFALLILIISSMPALADYASPTDILIKQNQQQMKLTKYYASKQVFDEKMHIMRTLNSSSPKSDITRIQNQMKSNTFGQNYRTK
ncbi:hypothetical protein KBA27_03820 [bacterium]|nr:hypothetical protein [bacterium]